MTADPPAATLRGRVAWVFDDFFDIDLIIGPARLHDRQANEPDYLRRWVMHDQDPDFVRQVRPGDVLVGGALFGYGHPHGQAMRAMRALGIRVVLGESFFPSFQQNETFHGMVLLRCPGIRAAVQRWDAIDIAWRQGRVRLPERGLALQHDMPTPHEIACSEAGG